MSLGCRRRPRVFAFDDPLNERNGALDLLRCQARITEHRLARAFGASAELMGRALIERVDADASSAALDLQFCGHGEARIKRPDQVHSAFESAGYRVGESLVEARN